MSDFSVFFNSHFQVETDLEQERLEEAFRLRYQVYYRERSICAEAASEKESDAFDAHAFHGVVRHRETGNTMATVRLARPCPSADSPCFPMEEAYPDLLLSHGITDYVLPRDTTAEISRFAISKTWRQHMRDMLGEQETNSLARAGWEFNGRCYPLVTFGLFVALMRLSAQNGITHWLAIMEPALLRLLSRFGIGFQKIGGVIDFHGRRQPCYGRVDAIQNRVRSTECDLFDLVQRDLAAIQPRPAASSRVHCNA